MMLHFLIATLILALGMSGAVIMGYTPASPAWYWLGPVLILSLGLALLLKRFSSWAVFFALPLACGLSYGFVNSYWPKSSLSETITGEDTQLLVETRIKLEAAHFAEAGPDAPDLSKLSLPAGWTVQIYADGLPGVRMLAFSPSGTLFASQPTKGLVVALPDLDKDGLADHKVSFAEGLDRPHGLAFQQTRLLVAEGSRLIRLIDEDKDLHVDRVELVSDDIPSGGGHWTRSLATGTDGSLYVSAGSSCNACLEQDPRRAAILRFEPGSKNGQIYATGLRNAVGLAFDSRTGMLWASENGRDHLGDELPPDEINLVRSGQDYGWPYCYGLQIPDPEYGHRGQCAGTEPAAVELPAHTAPLGIAFAHLPDLLPEYSRFLLIASHGSWNRSSPRGYHVLAVPFADGRPAGKPHLLITGWLQGARAWGRPVAVAIAPDGAFMVSDDLGGRIYRFARSRDKKTGSQ